MNQRVNRGQIDYPTPLAGSLGRCIVRLLIGAHHRAPHLLCSVMHASQSIPLLCSSLANPCFSKPYFFLLSNRRDSFITHRAFCDALAEENKQPPAPASSPAAANPLIHSSDFSAAALDIKHHHNNHHHHHSGPALPSKSLTMFPGSATLSSTSSPSIFSLPSSTLHNHFPSSALPPPPPSSSGAHMSATALLQKAAELGATASTNNNNNNNNSNSNSNSRSLMAYSEAGLVGGGMEGMNMQFYDGSSSNGLTVDFLGVSEARPIGMLDHHHHRQQNNSQYHHHNLHDQFQGYHGHHENGMQGLHQFQQQDQQHGHGDLEKAMWGDML